MAIKKLVHHLNLRSTRLLPKLTLTSKIIISFFILISLSLVVKSISAAASEGSGGGTSNTIETSELTIDTTNLQGYLDKQTAITKGNNQESWINESLTSNVVSINQAIGGTLTKDSLTNAWVPGGMIGFTNNAIASLYQPPISGVQYIAQSVSSFLGKPVYASNGYGFDKLNGILGMWKVTRNAAYTLISLFFIIVGIMIMLRVKINPQTTVTIQSSIPKIITALILVTFSYAIAGLLIDFSNIFLGIILSLLSQGIDGGLNTLIGKTVPETMSLGFFDFWKLSSKYLIPLWSLIPTFLAGVIGGITTGMTLAAGGWGVAAGILSFALITAIIYIYAFVQLVKLFIGLAKCYISFIIHVVISPIEIGMGAIPGSKINFSSWLNQIIAQLVTFPATIIFLVFVIFLTNAVKSTSTFLWSNSLLGWGEVVGGIVGLAALSILSKIPQIVPEFIFKIKPSPIGKAISDNTKGIVDLSKGSVKYAIAQKGQKWESENEAPESGEDTRTSRTKFKYGIGKIITNLNKKRLS